MSMNWIGFLNWSLLSYIDFLWKYALGHLREVAGAPIVTIIEN